MRNCLDRHREANTGNKNESTLPLAPSVYVVRTRRAPADVARRVQGAVLARAMT